jgi:hypothetical protein
MTNQNDADRFLERPVRTHGEDAPDVEGHIRKAHTARETVGPESAPGIRVEATEGSEDDTPDVEGHLHRW